MRGATLPTGLKKHISAEFPIDEMDLTSAESKAIYKQIQNYVFEKYRFKVLILCRHWK